MTSRNSSTPSSLPQSCIFPLLLPLLLLVVVNFGISYGVGTFTITAANAGVNTVAATSIRGTDERKKKAGNPNQLSFGGGISGFADHIDKLNMGMQTSNVRPLQSVQNPHDQSEMHNHNQRQPQIQRTSRYTPADAFSQADVDKVLKEYGYSQLLTGHGLSRPLRQEFFVQAFFRELIASNPQKWEEMLSNEPKLRAYFDAYMDKRECDLHFQRTLMENNINEQEEHDFHRELIQVLKEKYNLDYGQAMDREHLLEFRIALTQTLSQRKAKQKIADFLPPFFAEYNISDWMEQADYAEFIQAMFKSVDALSPEKIELSAVRNLAEAFHADLEQQAANRKYVLDYAKKYAHWNGIKLAEGMEKILAKTAVKLRERQLNPSQHIEDEELHEILNQALTEYLQEKGVWMQGKAKRIFKAMLSLVLRTLCKFTRTAIERIIYVPGIRENFF